MKRIFLAIAVACIVSVISILAFALTPGYLSYQQLRSSTHLEPKQIEKIVIELLAATRAKDKIETGENFSELDLRVILDAKMEDRHAMVLRMGHLDIMSIDPSGTELKHHLFKAVSRDVAIMAQDNSSLGLTMRKYAYRCAIREPQFMDVLMAQLGTLDNLHLTDGEKEDIREDIRINTAEQVCTRQPATRPELKSEGSDKPQPEAEGRSQ